MMNRKSFSLVALVSVVVVLADAGNAALADGQAGPQYRDSKIGLILTRQKGHQLKIFLKSSRAMYVNGKTVSSAELTKIVEKSGLKRAIVTAEPYVDKKKIADVQTLIEKAGIKDVKLATPPKRPGKDEKLGIIIARQKGNQLKVYMRNSRAMFVNGKSLGTGDLKMIVSKLELKQAVITAEPNVALKRVVEVRGLLTKAGVQDVKVVVKK